MIVRMKKITLVITQVGRQNMLSALRALGVVHIKNIVKPLSDSLNVVEAEIVQAKQAISILSEHKAEKDVQAISWAEQEMREKIKSITDLSKESSAARQEIDLIRERLEYFSPWGTFSAKDIKEL